MRRVVRRFGAVLGLGLLAAPACDRRPAPLAIQLVDLFRPEMVVGRAPAAGEPPPRAEWRFDGPAAPADGRSWEAGPGVAGLEVRDGRLQGRTTSDAPVLHLETRPHGDLEDVIEDVEVRMRVSAGANLSVGFSGQPTIDLADIARQPAQPFWSFATPILAGDELRTYVLRSGRGTPMARTRHIVVRPTDAAGARFEIESLRLVSRKEQLATIPSGIGWQGLSEIYRETVVARTPETVRFSLTLPARPRLEVALGTLDDEPVTFRVAAGEPENEEVVAERTVTTPHRWEPASVDLSRYAGRRVSLTLSLLGKNSGLLGLWGAPVVRSAGTLSRGATAGKSAARPPQGVVLVWVDTLRRDELEPYGYARPTSPVVRQMALEGTLFKDAVAQATWTKVSTPSVLTSLYPATHGVRDFSDRLPSSAVTLAEVFRAAGYATLSMCSSPFTGRFTNLHQGFEEVQEAGSLKGEQRMSKTARTLVDRLAPWIAAHRDVPFFVFLHVQDPHDPYKPPAPYDTLWADPSREAEHERAREAVRKGIADPILRGWGLPNAEELQSAGLPARPFVDHERAWYDGSIRAMDVEIGRLLETLRNLRLERRTLVVYTADHGEEFLEHGRMGHGQTTYGELADVPLLMWGPGTVPAGRVVDETVQSIDVMPTLLELCRLPVPAAAQGHSLLPLLEGPAGSRATAHAAGPSSWAAVTEKAPTRETGGVPPRDAESYAIVLDGWKLVHNTKARPARQPEFELYDHRKDPLDTTDLAGAHPDVVKRLARELDLWQRSAEAARLPPDSVAREGLGQEELERLRALGYIQ
jgi:arylsulfatase A-like enzyme